MSITSEQLEDDQLKCTLIVELAGVLFIGFIAYGSGEEGI
jgi:hypothetical protein